MSNFNYFHGGEAEQFSFFRIPRALIRDKRFQDLSTEAKLLYALMLDRMGLSLQSGWLDEANRVFIYYTVREVEETLSCGHNKAVRLLADLEQFGLIERVKQGQGKPTKIYIKNFTIVESEEQAEAAEVEKSDLKEFEKETCAFPISKPLDCPKGECNYTEKNYTEISYTDPSIHPPTPGARKQEIDRCDLRERLKRQIDYDILKQSYPYDDVESMLEMLVDVMSNSAPTVRIGGQIYPAAAVKERFSQLGREHITYVIDSFKQTTTKINNIRGYLLTALYHAPVTIGPYYSAAVRHDFS